MSVLPTTLLRAQQLQKMDPVFNREVDVLRPALNFEPKYRVTMMTTEEWSRGPGNPPCS
jgi:hypothetical protein